MRDIPLTQGKVALVDDADYDWLNQWKWYAHKARSGGFYAMRRSLENGKYFTIRMHRQILGLEQGDKRYSDHQNHNTLNNCRDNIRICTSRQNSMNRESQSNTTSRFKGVSWYKPYKKWVAQICINKKVKNLGYWVIEEVAALRYDMVAIHEFGEFAVLNFN